MVPEAGIEPARADEGAADFKSAVSTNFTTRAWAAIRRCKTIHDTAATNENAPHEARRLYFGSPTWARTRDLRINSPALYRLSYRGIAASAKK